MKEKEILILVFWNKNQMLTAQIIQNFLVVGFLDHVLAITWHSPTVQTGGNC